MAFNRLWTIIVLIFASPSSGGETARTDREWTLNNDPIALEFAVKELNYQVLENYILARAEDPGTEKVRVLKLKAGDARALVNHRPSFSVDSLAQFTQKTLARGIKGLELTKREIKPGNRSIQVYQYQIQGSTEPLVVSTYSFTRQGEILVATHLAPISIQRAYQSQVLKLVEHLAQK